jgi:proteasome lid subunit RPN8/RPN11
MLQPVVKPSPTNGGSRRHRVLGEVHPDAVRIFVYESILERILDYSETDGTRELGGFLLGGYYRDETPYVEVRHFLEAVDTRSAATAVTFSHDTWAAAGRKVEAHFTGERVVGWHHTHPRLRVFLSGYDLFIHRHFFAEPWQIAMVVDPVWQEFGFFQWRGGAVVGCGFTCVREQCGSRAGAR